MKNYSYKNLYLPKPITPHRAESLNLRSVYSDPTDLKPTEQKIKYYKYRFPVEYWKRKSGVKVPTLFCELTIDTYDWSVVVDVRTLQNDTYADFYCTDLNDKSLRKTHPMLVEVYKRIDKELKKLGVVQRKDTKSETKEGNINNDNNKKKTDSSTDRRFKSGTPQRRSPKARSRSCGE